jgi:GT2 family glycosyltransferase
LVYVVLLNWNGWRYTAKCVESLRRLTYPNYGVVVDNGSTHESAARLKSAYPDILVIENGDRAVAGASVISWCDGKVS